MNTHGTAVGIDFGTSNTLAAVRTAEGLRVCEIDPINVDPHLLPTLLYFSRYGGKSFGRAAMHEYQKDPDGRFIRGLKWALPEYGPEDIFRIIGQRYRVPDLVALVLKVVRDRIQEQLGVAVTEVTLGRPVHFSPDPEIDARAEGMLRDGALKAGFETVRFLSEPEAATRYYFATEPGVSEATVLVFDFGGGTLDLCLARFGGSTYDVLSTGGASIGGSYLDQVLFEKKLLHHLGHGKKWGRGLDLPNHIFTRLVNPDAAWRLTDVEYARLVHEIVNASNAWGTTTPELRTFATVVSKRMGADLFAAIEVAKMRLAEESQTEIRFEGKGVRIVEPLSRADLRVVFRDQLETIRTLIHDTLAQAGKTPTDVDRVLLAGGSSALICVQELLRDLFGDERVPLRQDLFTSIVSGLALDAAGR